MNRDSKSGVPEDCFEEWTRVSAAGAPSDDQSMPRELMKLSRTIEGEIIPRLMMLFDQEQAEAGPSLALEDCHEDATSADQVRTAATAMIDSVPEFADILLRNDAPVAARYVESLRASGIPLPAIYLGLLAPTARRLGLMWENDECNFTEVTVGVSRMHQVLLQFSPCFRATARGDADDGRNALIVPAPGEQHTFGLFMVVEFFRRAGWNVWSGNPSNRTDLLSLVKRQRFDVVGYSIAAERNVDAMEQQVKAVRNESSNPRIKIIVGGNLVDRQPGIGAQLGADAVALADADPVAIASAVVAGAR